MRIGIDGIPLTEARTGIGHYTFELARHLALVSATDEFELIAPSPMISVAGEPHEDLPHNLSVVHARVNPLGRYWWAIGLPLYVKQNSLALFHGTNYDVPLWNRCRTVVSIHDLSLLLHPATHEKHLVRRARRRLPLMARRATMIITDSESVKREICEHLRTRPEKIAVIPLAPRHIFRPIPKEETVETRRRLGVEDEFILFVGTVEPRKNLITLVRAFDEILRTTSLRPQLVIAGRKGWLTDELFSFIEKSGVGSRLHFTGYISDEDLRALYSSCLISIYPSLYEGFGLPPLEAMACGAPVITSQIPVIKETVGTAARLVAPTDVRALAQSIVELLEDTSARHYLSSAGLRRAAEFSWERTARATLEVYYEALKLKVENKRSEYSL